MGMEGKLVDVYERESEWFCMCVRACGVRKREEGGGALLTYK